MVSHYFNMTSFSPCCHNWLGRIFLVRIFLYSDRVWSKYPYSDQIQENADQKKLRIWTVFKQCILFENLKILTSSNPTVQYFLLKLRTRFLLTNVYKRGRGIFLFCLDLDLFAKSKRPGFYTFVFYIFINKSRSKRNLKNPEHVFVDITM